MRLVGVLLLVIGIAGSWWLYKRAGNGTGSVQPSPGPGEGTASPDGAGTKPPDSNGTTEKPPEIPPGQQDEPPAKRIEHWVALLESPNLRANIQVAFQMEKRIRAGGEESIALLTELVKTEDSQLVRSWAVRLLGDFPSKTPMLFLAGLLRQDADEGVRTVAANALGNIGDKTVLRELTDASLEDSSKGVNDAARKAIEKIEAREAGAEAPSAPESPR